MIENVNVNSNSLGETRTASHQQNGQGVPFNICIVPDIGGATGRMSNDNLMGLSEWLERQKTKPNFVTIMGGAMAYVPPTGTVRYRDAMLELMDGVNNMDDAAAVIKLPVVRILSQLPPTTQVVYLMGKDDEKNIDLIKDRLVNECSFNQHLLAKRLVNMESAIESRKDIIRTAKISEEALEKSEKPISEVSKELSNVSMKITQNEEELDEFKRMRKSLKKLYLLSIEKISEASAKKEAREVEKEIDNGFEKKLISEKVRMRFMTELYAPLLVHKSAELISKELETARKELKSLRKKLRATEEGSVEWETTNKRAKFVSNKERILNLRNQENAEETSILESESRMKPAMIFTRNIPTTPDVVKEMANGVGFDSYLSTLKYALGRKREVTIQWERVHVYPEKQNGNSFNVIVASSLDNITKVFKKVTNTEAPIRLGRIAENRSGQERDSEGRPEGSIDIKTLAKVETNFLFTSANMYSSVALDPIQDWSSSLIISNPMGTLWDLGALGGLHNKRIRTRETEAFEKGLLDSSVSIWKFDPKTKTLEHEVLTNQFLRDMRIKGDLERERDVIEAIKSGEKGKESEIIPGVKEGLEKAIIQCKRPSELKDRDIAMLRREGHLEESLHSLAPYAYATMPQETTTMKLALFGDVHLGNNMRYDLVEASIKDVREKKPDIVIFNGDVLEGDLGNFKNVSRSIDLPGHSQEYLKSLKTRGMSETAIHKEMLRFMMERDRSAPIQNVDSQIKLFNDAFMPLIDDVLGRGGIVIFTSGNHYNMTTKGWMFDEAIKLYFSTTNHMKAHEEDGKLEKGWEERVKIIPGSEFGAGDLNMDGLQTHFAHKLGNAENVIETFLETKKTDAVFSLISHFHKYKEVKTANKLVIETLPMKDTLLDTYLSRINSVAHVVDGYVYCELDVRNGEIISYRSRPIIERELIARGVLQEDPHRVFVLDQQTVKSSHNPQKVGAT
ncbi:MAG: hypothetical protein ABSD68_04015 [Candidatus Micrarchaeales archaeon]